MNNWVIYFFVPIICIVLAIYLISQIPDKYWVSVFDWLKTGMD